MALKATIFKADLQIADMDRNYYQDHALTLARHPSETDERMMVRLLTFVLHADTELSFTKGLSTGDEPDLWLKELSGEIDLWIDIGQPDEKRIRKACGRARQVYIYCYSGRSADIWWEQNGAKLQRFKNLKVINLADNAGAALAGLAHRNMQLQCTVQDGQVWLVGDNGSVEVSFSEWK
ncbi:YaeQ protein [hydrothermal vent metagenome]|uniref:YaeQ protein n=1 Tax=hydrothermal vent metagenome TaxID=652676 RepID=A0A3B1BGH2_9ZZZZ